MIKPKKIPQAQEFMQRRMHTVTPDMRLSEVIAFLLKHRISNAPVVMDHHGRGVLVGFISERDCLEHLSNEVFYGCPSQPQSAGTIMQKHPVCISPETDIFTLASIFVNHGMRHLPVVTDHELVGIVSRRDILRALDAYYREMIQLGEFERSPPDVHELINHRFIVAGR